MSQLDHRKQTGDEEICCRTLEIQSPSVGGLFLMVEKLARECQ